MSRGQPREQYERTYIVVPRNANSAFVKDLIDYIWQIGERWTVGGSADDSAVGNLDVRRAVVLDPKSWANDDWPDGLTAAWYDKYYPGIIYWPLPFNNDVQLKGRLLSYHLKEMDFSLAAPTTHIPLVVTQEFGANGTHLGADYKSSWSSWSDKILCAYDGKVAFAGNTLGSLGWAVMVDSVLPDGSAFRHTYGHLVANSLEVIATQNVSKHQVLGKANSTGTSTGDHLHFSVHVKDVGYADPDLLIEQPTKIGINDPNAQGAADWLIANNPNAFLYIPIDIGLNPRPFDFSRYPGEVCLNIRYGWATADVGEHGGTLPKSQDDAAFIKACVSTILESKSVGWFSITNEANSPREWSDTITPSRLASIFNQVASNVRAVRTDLKLSLGGFDPFNVESGLDPRQWTAQVWDMLAQHPDFVDVHGYIRGPDPALIGSTAKFDTIPWQYLNFPGCIQTLLDVLPDWAKNLPVINSEFNHLWRTVEGNDGWVNDERATNVVRAAMKVKGLYALCLYRWQGDDWAIVGNEFVKNIIKEYK